MKHFYRFVLDSTYMSDPSLATFIAFLGIARNAHTIDITVRADGRIHHYGADFLKHIKTFLMDNGDPLEKHVGDSHLGIYFNKQPELEYEPGYWFRHLFDKDGKLL